MSVGVGGPQFVQLVPPRMGTKDATGMCLRFAQSVFGAPVAHRSATDAANATKFRHHTRELPDVAAVVWFDHYGTYQNEYANWGHVVAWVPGHGFLSSPGSGYGQQWFPSIDAVERTFNAKFRFWSEDINGLRVAEPGNQRKEIPMPALIRNYDGSIGFVSDNGTLDPITTMNEVESLKATGIVGNWVQMPDGNIWNTLTARTVRLRAQSDSVDEKQLAREVAALIVPPVVEALSNAGTLTRKDVEQAVSKVMSDILAKAAA